MGRRLIKAWGMKDMEQLGKMMPMKRVCEPEDVAEIFCFLASEAGSYVTGQVVCIKGGSVAAFAAMMR